MRHLTLAAVIFNFSSYVVSGAGIHIPAHNSEYRLVVRVIKYKISQMNSLTGNNPKIPISPLNRLQSFSLQHNTGQQENLTYTRSKSSATGPQEHECKQTKKRIFSRTPCLIHEGNLL